MYGVIRDNSNLGECSLRRSSTNFMVGKCRKLRDSIITLNHEYIL